METNGDKSDTHVEEWVQQLNGRHFHEWRSFVCAAVTEQTNACDFPLVRFLINYIHLVCGFFLFSSVHILARLLSGVCMFVLISVLTLSSMSGNQPPTVSSTDVNFLMREEAA